MEQQTTLTQLQVPVVTMVFSDSMQFNNEENNTAKLESHSLNIGNLNGHDDDDDSDTGSDDASDRINIMDGLSAEALAALLEFQLGGANDGDEGEDDDGNRTHTDMYPNNNAETSTKFDKDTLCATYRPEDASRIAETLRRLHDRDHKKHQSHDTGTVSVHDHDDTIDGTSTTNEISVQPMSETIFPQPSDIDGGDDRTRHLVKVLEVDGVVRINNVLSSKLCQECSNYINRTLLEQDNIRNSSTNTNDVSHNDDIMFGNVFARDHRYDMYLHPGREMLISDILSVLLHPERSVLGQLFQTQLQQQQPPIPSDSEKAREMQEGEKKTNNHSSSTEEMTTNTIGDDTCGSESPYSSKFVDAEFHELSCLISDPGSIAQPLHPDSPYYPAHAPLWTVFIALQDITPEMGGTVVIPKTHTDEVHQLLRTGNSHHNIKSLLQSNKYQYRRADLNIGDCIVMDSRIFHYGGANYVSSNARRTLLYFTIRNPYHQTRGYPDCNSLYPDLDGSLKLSRFFL